MRIKEFRTAYNDIYILPISDCHIGDKAFTADSEAKLKGYIDWVKKTPNAFCILNGDILNVATRESKTSPFEQNMDLKDQIEKATILFKPIKDKIIGSIDGNHSMDRNTEVLTDDGWKKVASITKIDKVAQFNIKTNEISFANPVSLENHYEDKIIEIEGRYTKQRVDALHDVIFDGKKIKALGLLKRECYEKSIPIFGKYSLPNKNKVNISNDYLKLLTWTIMDATIIYEDKYVPNSKKTRIQFKLSIPEKISNLKQLLDEMGINYTYKLCKKTGVNKLQPYYIRIYGNDARKIVAYLDNRKKVFPKSFKNLDKKQLLSVLNTITITDGYRHYSSVGWSSIEKENIDIIQEACIKNELPFNYKLRNRTSGFENGKPLYIANFYLDKANDKFNYKLKIKEKSYKDNVYCLTMPQGTLVTRIDGKVAFTGNCVRISDFTGYSPMISLCERLGIDYMKDSAIYLIRMGCRKNDKCPRTTFTIYSHHGNGGGKTPGSKMNRIDAMRAIVANADMYFGSHTHMLGAIPAVTQIVNEQTGKVDIVRQMLIDTGSYLEWNNSYAERIMLPPTKLGSPKIHLIVKRLTEKGVERTHKDVHVSI